MHTNGSPRRRTPEKGAIVTINSVRGAQCADDFIRALPADDSVSSPELMLPARDEGLAILIELTHQAGVWEVTRGGAISGRYLAHQPAFEAVETVAHKIISEGVRVDIMLCTPR